MSSIRIFLSPPHLSGLEKSYIDEALDTNWVAPLGPHVDRFEAELSEATGSPHVVCLASGTSAIHIGLILLGVCPDDEVIVQSFTFAASANPVSYLGARPVFVGSEGDTWNMCPELLEESIEDRLKKRGKLPKAIIPVHLYGMPAKMDRIMAVARRYDIPVIEDAAESLGSHRNGHLTGIDGTFGILSFNGNKIITTSGGGALLAHSGKAAERARFLATQARDTAPHYQHSTVGYNYRMSNICAGIGRAQLSVLAERVRSRRTIYDTYERELGKKPGISFLQEPEGYHSNRWLTTVLFDPDAWGDDARERVRVALLQHGIEARPLWKPLHLQPVFSESPAYDNGICEALFHEGLCLPSGSALTEGQQAEVIAHVIAALEDRA